MISRIFSHLLKPIKDEFETPAFQPINKHVNKSWLERELQQETEVLKNDIARLAWSKKPGGHVQADFREFPTPLMTKAMHEKDYQIVGRVKLVPNPVKTVPLIIGPKDLRQIHQTVIG